MAAVSGGTKLNAKLEEIARQIGAGQTTVRAGFLKGATYPSGETVATIAAIQEFGAPSRNIPPRPFMRATVHENSRKWGKMIGKLIVDNDYDGGKTLALMGEVMKGDIQQSIASFSNPGNAPSTIKRKGFDAPLRDSGHMLQSVDAEVVEGDGSE